MAALKGNKFWMARTSHGDKPMFASPDIGAETMPDVGYYWPSTNNAWTVIEPPSAEFLAEHPWREDTIVPIPPEVAAFPL